MKTYEWAVVGSGIAGISIAEILSRQGHSVVLIEKNKSLDIKIVNYKVLNKTGDMAIIISKLKEIRDHKISKIKEKKHSNKIKQEIRKLNETIALAEDLFKKELLNL